MGDWRNKFYEQQDINYTGITGQISLDLTHTVDPHRYVIDSEIIEPESLHVGDIDGDGDADVITTAYGQSGLTWWENTAGDGTTWESYYIGDGGSGSNPHYVWLADLDNDDDLDAVLVLVGAGAIVWWENADGNGES